MPSSWTQSAPVLLRSTPVIPVWPSFLRIPVPFGPKPQTVPRPQHTRYYLVWRDLRYIDSIYYEKFRGKKKVHCIISENISGKKLGYITSTGNSQWKELKIKRFCFKKHKRWNVSFLTKSKWCKHDEVYDMINSDVVNSFFKYWQNIFWKSWDTKIIFRWGGLHFSEKFSSGTINLPPKNKLTIKCSKPYSIECTISYANGTQP